MTTPLTDTQKRTIRKALAAWDGKETEFNECPTCYFYKAQGHASFCDQIPDYCASLDACHAIEVKLTDEQHHRFRIELRVIVAESDAPEVSWSREYVSANAEETSLALYRALNLGELGE